VLCIACTVVVYAQSQGTNSLTQSIYLLMPCTICLVEMHVFVSLTILQLSTELYEFFGSDEAFMSRPQVVKQLWDYIKSKDLQNPADRREVYCALLCIIMQLRHIACM
jgi:SWIB/MDM2 domain